jgi:hypothetical protein
MYRLDDAFDTGIFASAPYDTVAGDQRADGSANIATVLAAVGSFNVRMHPETADHHAVLRLAMQGVVQLFPFVGLVQTTLVVSLNATLLPFRQF